MSSTPEQEKTTTENESPPVPYGVAVDDRPAPKPSRAATNNAEDRRRAFLLIGGMLGLVLLLVILGNTLLRPAIVAQRERMLVNITQQQVDDLADLCLAYYEREGVAITGFADLQDDDLLETSDGRDLWGNPFAFVTSQSGDSVLMRVRSAGPDGEFETNDDIVSERAFDSANREP